MIIEFRISPGDFAGNCRLRAELEGMSPFGTARQCFVLPGFPRACFSHLRLNGVREDIMALASKHQSNGNRLGISAARRAIDAPNGRGDFIDQTLVTWQPRAKRQLTREDGREIIENMTGFFPRFAGVGSRRACCKESENGFLNTSRTHTLANFYANFRCRQTPITAD